MCLVTFSRKPSIAEEDIVCYKLFCTYGAIRGFMFTSIVNYKVVIPENSPTIMDDTNKPVKIENVPIGSISIREKILDKPAYGIRAGMIHAYRNSDLIQNYTFYKKFKCIIPKGTEYYIGLKEDICAKKLLIIEQVK